MALMAWVQDWQQQPTFFRPSQTQTAECTTPWLDNMSAIHHDLLSYFPHFTIFHQLPFLIVLFFAINFFYVIRVDIVDVVTFF